MDISKFLSRVLGVYFLIISTLMVMNLQQFTANVNQLINAPALMFITGFFILIIGLLMVISHNIWQWNWRIIITFIAWLILIKGIVILFDPSSIDNLSLLFIENKTFAYGCAAVNFLLGLLLSIFGFNDR